MPRVGPGNGSLLLNLGICLILLQVAGVKGRPGTPGQAGEQALPLQLRHQVTVALKLIQVFVTDTKGRPILDLGKDDFTVYDNGKLQAVTEFEKHALAIPGGLGTAVAPATASSASEAAPLLNRKFIFLIDYVRNELEGVMKAGNAACEFLDTKVRPGDEVALFTFSSIGGLKLQEYLTSDHARVKAAIRKLRDAPGITPVTDESGLPGHEPMGMEVLSAEIFGRHGGHAGAASRDLFAEVAAWATALQAIPGQKNIILFSRGFGAAVVRQGAGGSALFQTMTRALASANAPVFSVNTTTGVRDKIALGVFPEASLDYLSRTTGGKYFPDVNYYARIAEDIQDATANYYVLGFYVPEVWDGKFHDLKVEIKRPGHMVFAQRGYFNPLPFNKLSPIERHLHLLEVVLGESASAKQNQSFPLTSVQYAGSNEPNVLLISEIPHDFREAVGDRAEFISLILDQNKAIIDGKRLEIDWADLPTGKVYQYATAALAPGRYEARAVVRNLDDGRSAVGSCSIEVVGTPDEGPVMFPPLFLRRGAEARYLNVVSPGEKGDAEGFSISRIFPFPAKEYVPLVGSLEPGAGEIWATLSCIWRGARGGEIELTCRLMPEGGEEEVPIPAEILDASSRDDADFYFLRFELPGLPPGRYRLEILAEEAGTGSAVRTAGWFTVRPPE